MARRLSGRMAADPPAAGCPAGAGCPAAAGVAVLSSVAAARSAAGPGARAARTAPWPRRCGPAAVAATARCTKAAPTAAAGPGSARPAALGPAILADTTVARRSQPDHQSRAAAVALSDRKTEPVHTMAADRRAAAWARIHGAAIRPLPETDQSEVVAEAARGGTPAARRSQGHLASAARIRRCLAAPRQRRARSLARLERLAGTRRTAEQRPARQAGSCSARRAAPCLARQAAPCFARQAAPCSARQAAPRSARQTGLCARGALGVDA